jgi:3'(2'), 5'-bisphosphate nucleotidase
MIQFSEKELHALIQLAKLAGDEILKVYYNPDSTQLVSKADASPLTAADLAANQVIMEGLGSIVDLPILSEESSPDDYQNRHQWTSFWLVDPLDGTKEFLARNGQFTVNIALVHQGAPVVGVVYQPVGERCYWGVQDNPEIAIARIDFGARRQIGSGEIQSIHCDSLTRRLDEKQSLRCLVSQHHHSVLSQQKLDLLQQVWPTPLEVIPLGSSLKICAIAEGSADLYLRMGPTSEWDTAAAQAVLEAAGGRLVSLNRPHATFTYNQRISLINNDFCAANQVEQILTWLDQAATG